MTEFLKLLSQRKQPAPWATDSGFLQLQALFLPFSSQFHANNFLPPRPALRDLERRVEQEKTQKTEALEYFWLPVEAW